MWVPCDHAGTSVRVIRYVYPEPVPRACTITLYDSGSVMGSFMASRLSCSKRISSCYARARHFALASARSFAHFFQFGMLRLVFGFIHVFFVSFAMSWLLLPVDRPTLDHWCGAQQIGATIEGQATAHSLN
jgi:hypothetical protein